jgi:hypothetical protein
MGFYTVLQRHHSICTFRTPAKIKVPAKRVRNDEKISSSFQGSNFLLRQGGETLA